jgi:hypothetical protein
MLILRGILFLPRGFNHQEMLITSIDVISRQRAEQTAILIGTYGTTTSTDFP